VSNEELLDVLRAVKLGDILRLQFVALPFPKRGIEILWSAILAGRIGVRPLPAGRATRRKLMVHSVPHLNIWLVDNDRTVDILATEAFVGDLAGFAQSMARYLVSCKTVQLK